MQSLHILRRWERELVLSVKHLRNKATEVRPRATYDDTYTWGSRHGRASVSCHSRARCRGHACSLAPVRENSPCGSSAACSTDGIVSSRYAYTTVFLGQENDLLLSACAIRPVLPAPCSYSSWHVHSKVKPTKPTEPSRTCGVGFVIAH